MPSHASIKAQILTQIFGTHGGIRSAAEKGERKGTRKEKQPEACVVRDVEEGNGGERVRCRRERDSEVLCREQVKVVVRKTCDEGRGEERESWTGIFGQYTGAKNILR
jgi:hypothetical protein